MRGIVLIALALSAASARGESNGDEIRARIRRWERNLPQYTLSPDVRPPAIGPSLTAVYAYDRTGADADPLAREFVMRGYYLLNALRAVRNMAPLTEGEIRQLHRALRLSRIEFVDYELFDNRGKRVVAVTDPDPSAPAYRYIRVYRKDWRESQRLGADLTQLVFHEYLRAIDKGDDHYVISKDLTVSEKDYRRQFRATPDCVSGRQAPASISLNLAFGTRYASATAYVNGRALSESGSFRVTQTVPLCTARAYRFEISLSDYRKTVYLYGGDAITLKIPSDQEFYRY